MARRFQAQLLASAERFEALLDRCLRPGTGLVDETPERLLLAMRHAALGGGKRLRPFLLVECAALFGFDRIEAMGAGLALECVHCYSLVHDDLPAMDDDDLRRGKPTVHRAFDEATAILAGDALLTLAFAILSGEERLPPETRCTLVALLAREAGARGMVGGQILDLAAEREVALDETEIARLQAMKTGALIAYACEAGAIVAGAGPEDRARLRRYGEILGLAFQLADDVLDETAAAADLGKASGKDRERGKKTLAALNGLEWSRTRLDELVAAAEKELEPFGDRASTLKGAARFAANRRN